MYKPNFSPITRLLLICILLVGCTVQPIQPDPIAIESEGSDESGDSSDAPSSATTPTVSEFVETTIVTKTISSNEEGDFCPLNVNGTGFTSRGGTFELVGDPPRAAYPLHGPLVLNTIFHTLTQLEAEPVPIEELLGNLLVPVVILVIDEFSRPIPREEGSEEGGEVATPLLPRPIRTHLWRLPLPPGVDSSTVASNAIVVAEVDIQEFDMGMTADAILTAIATMSAVTGAEKFVLNMSWVVVPCGAVPNNVDTYIDVMCAVPPAQDLEEIASVQKLLDWLATEGISYNLCVGGDQPLDPILPATIKAALYNTPEFAQAWASTMFLEFGNSQESVINQVLDCLGNPGSDNESCSPLIEIEVITIPNGEGTADQQFIPVAASGNTSPDRPITFPFEPALWPNVISVSANDAINYYANDGEIAMKGIYPYPPPPDEIYEGTSFAAPRFSTWAAVHLLLGGTSPCIDGDDHHPALGYKEDWNPEDWNHDGLNTHPANLSLTEVTDRYCQQFHILEGLGWPTAASTDWLP